MKKIFQSPSLLMNDIIHRLHNLAPSVPAELNWKIKILAKLMKVTNLKGMSHFTKRILRCYHIKLRRWLCRPRRLWCCWNSILLMNLRFAEIVLAIRFQIKRLRPEAKWLLIIKLHGLMKSVQKLKIAESKL